MLHSVHIGMRDMSDHPIGVYMVSIRAAKSKGNQHEYACQHSLSQIYPDIYRTAERGFVRQFDLCDDVKKAAFECKRLKAMSWNAAVKILEKLERVAPDDYAHYVLFKSNRQPCLVMFRAAGRIVVQTFEDHFGARYESHRG